MSLLDSLSATWAIRPEVFSQIIAIANRHMAGESVDLAAVAAGIGRPLNNERRDMVVSGETGIIAIQGVVARRMNMLMDISGGTSTQVIAGQLDRALAQPTIRNIVLDIDSPGGTTDGTAELTDLIFAARDKKPIVAVGNLMASAAYQIASAASKVFLTSVSALAGSIGVVAHHVDVSGRESQLGVKTTEIAAGKYKRIDSSYAPLSAEGRATIQDQVDYQYAVFVDSVARNRGTTPGTVLERMADGRIFIGAQAVAAGLADGIQTLDQVLTTLSAPGGAARMLSPAGSGAYRYTTPAAAVSPGPSAASVASPGASIHSPATPAAKNSSSVPLDAAAMAARFSAKRNECQKLGVYMSDSDLWVLTEAPRADSPTSIAPHARLYQAQAAAQGRTVTASDAVTHVLEELANGK